MNRPLPRALSDALARAKASFDAFEADAAAPAESNVRAIFPLPYPSTPKQSRAWFDAHGIAIKDWCETHGLDRYIVTDLLRGRLKGLRGESHRAAVLLGLKADPDSTMKLAA